MANKNYPDKMKAIVAYAPGDYKYETVDTIYDGCVSSPQKLGAPPYALISPAQIPHASTLTTISFAFSITGVSTVSYL